MHSVLITGASGTIGTELTRQLREQQWNVTAWNRDLIPIDDYYKMEEFIKRVRPEVLFHLAYSSKPQDSWQVNYEWTSELAWITKLLGIKFLFASTNLVFKKSIPAPYTLQSVPDADTGYGLEKRKAEEKIFHQNESAIVARLGWQIDINGGANNMINFIERKMKADGVIRASTKWLPAASFLDDTCRKLLELARGFSPGVYMLDSNEHWNLFDIASALNQKFNFGWKVESTSDFIFDSRMVDERVNMVSLKERLPALNRES